MKMLNFTLISFFFIQISSSFSSEFSEGDRERHVSLICEEFLTDEDSDDQITPQVPEIMEEEGDFEAFQACLDYRHYYEIASIRAVLEKARERQKTLECKASEVLVCLDIDYFSVKTNGGSDPLEECTAEVYKTLREEGFTVLRLTARGHGLDAVHHPHLVEDFHKGNAALIETLGDTSSVFFPQLPLKIELLFAASQEKPSFKQYGYYLSGTLFAGRYKADMLYAFLVGLEFFPYAIIMGDDNEEYLADFIDHGGLTKFVGEEIHLLHMLLETHLSDIF